MDTFNKFAVGVVGDDIAILRPATRLTPHDAMMFAAYLVLMASMANPKLPGIETYLEAVKAT